MTISQRYKRWLDAQAELRNNSYDGSISEAFAGVDAFMILLQGWQAHEACRVGDRILRHSSLRSNMSVRDCNKREISRTVYEALIECGSATRDEAINWSLQCLTECECCTVSFGVWFDDSVRSSGIQRLHQPHCWKYEGDQMQGISSVYATVHEARQDQQSHSRRLAAIDSSSGH